jgi:hypothetical protein
VACFKELSRHLPGETEEIHEETPGQWSPGRDLNPGPPEYEPGVATIQLLLSVTFFVKRFRKWVEVQ